MRGFFAIGIENGKFSVNLGTLIRSAKLFNASFVFTIGKRYKKEASDTMKAYRHLPILFFEDVQTFKNTLPKNTKIIGIEMTQDAIDIVNYVHPENAVYLLGSEDKGLSKEAMAICDEIIRINTRYSLDVSVAGSIIMYDRILKSRI